MNTNYAAMNARGCMVRTFDTKDRAIKWVKDHACEHNGLRVVKITMTKRVVYDPALEAAA